MGKKLTKNIVKKAIAGSGGVLLAAHRRLGNFCTYSCLHNFINEPENVELKALLLEEKEKIIDLAENKLHKKVNEEDWNAIKFTLQTVGAKRGYQEKQQIQHFGSEGIEITFKDSKVIDAEVIPDNEQIQDRTGPD